MSLDTVLQIGKVLRSSEDSLKYFKYVAPCPKDNKTGEWPICITIPVNPDFTYDWNGMIITPENKREKLYYLKYSTSDNDSSPKKYLFGDICYTRKSEINKKGKIKGIKDFGNFTFEKGQRNAFLNAQKTYTEIVDTYFINTILPVVQKIEDKKNHTAIIKTILNGHKNENPVEIPKKLDKYSSMIEYTIQRIREDEKKCELIQFHLTFEKEIEKFNRLLLFAPAFEYVIMNEKEELETVLSNNELLKEKYIKVILEKNSTILKRFLEAEESLDSLSPKTRDNILQFADFSVFIHFEYIKNGNKKSWHQFDEAFKLIKDKLNSEIIRG